MSFDGDDQQPDLFVRSPSDPTSRPSGIHGPLAERLRPRTFADFVGQDHLLAENQSLRQAIESDQVPSLILWGPPGLG